MSNNMEGKVLVLGSRAFFPSPRVRRADQANAVSQEEIDITAVLWTTGDPPDCAIHSASSNWISRASVTRLDACRIFRGTKIPWSSQFNNKVLFALGDAGCELGDHDQRVDSWIMELYGFLSIPCATKRTRPLKRSISE